MEYERLTGEKMVREAVSGMRHEFRIDFSDPASEYALMGEGKVWSEVPATKTYLLAEWWDRGSGFTLFLGRRYLIEGLPFVSEFMVQELVDKNERSEKDIHNVTSQIQDQLDILRRFGIEWLRGDFTREPYIRHDVRRVEQQAEPGEKGSSE